MRSKLLGGVAALALTGCAVLASVGPASAAWYGRGWGWGGWGPGGVAAGVVGGAVAAATSPLWAPGYYDYYPGYGYGYGPAYPRLTPRLTQHRPTASRLARSPRRAAAMSPIARRISALTIRRLEHIRVTMGSSIPAHKTRTSSAKRAALRGRLSC